jgi:hypothetical protein
MQVPSSLLRPNLHVGTCRLRHQEAERGPAANESEWYMERCVSIQLHYEGASACMNTPDLFRSLLLRILDL